MRRLARGALPSLALLLALARCAKDPTALYIEVTAPRNFMSANPRVGVRVLDAVTQQVIDGEPPKVVTNPPFIIVVVASGAHPRVIVEATGFAGMDNDPGAVGRVVASFTDDAVMRASLSLAPGCRAIRGAMGMARVAFRDCPAGQACDPPLSACRPDETCADSGDRCIPAAVTPTRHNY